MKEIFSGKLPAVLNNPTPFILEFGSDRFPESQRLHSVLENISDSLQDQVQLYYVNVDKVPEVKTMFQVEDLPTMILFKDGEPLDKMIGHHSEQEIQKFLTQ
ncbi:thioredoxin [Desulfosporosinus sp. HMP52]|nr:thioredoxin [Desulfosporosinus sp. HMP52]